MKKPKKKSKPKIKPEDGLYWELWRNGICVESGFNDGARDIAQWHVVIPAFDDLYKSNK
jgi:hypothetical protein